MKRPNYRLLTVPLVGQRRNSDGEWLTLDNGDGKGPQPHGDMACWYAAACMVSYYFRPGPRLGLPDVWRKDQGMAQASISKLIRVEGLMPLDPPKPFKTEVTTEWLEDALWRYGPIWAGGAFHMGQQHAIVVTGVKDTVVFYNDPWEPAAKTMDIKMFRSALGPHDNCLLVKDSLKTHY